MVKIPRIKWKKNTEKRSFARSWLFTLGLGLLVGFGALLGQGSVRTDSGLSAPCRVEVTADTLPLRSAPEPAASSPGNLRRGDLRGATTTVRNGYRELSDGAWALDQYLRPLPPLSECTPR